MKTINKAELIGLIADDTGESKRIATTIIDSMIGVMQRELRAGSGIDIRGLVKLEPVAKPARTGRNPITGASIEIPARTAIKAKASKAILGVEA